ncbi:MAG: acyl-CoA reductase, partial [bacterium]
DTPAPRPAPLHRFLRLLPVRDEAELLERLEPYRGHLSSVALAGLDEPTEMSLEGALARLGVSRVTEPGRLQTPPVDWPHDGMPLLIPMLRFVQSDRARTP